MNAAIHYVLILLTTCGSALVVFGGTIAILKIKKQPRIKLSFFVLFLYGLLLWFQPGNWLLSDLVVLLVAVIIGHLIGTAIVSKPAFVTFLLTVALVDFLSFSGGLTAKIISDYREGNNLLLQFLSVSIPLNSKVIPIIGLGDLVVISSIYVGLIRLGYPRWESSLVPLVGLLLALMVGLAIGGVSALPFIAGIVISYVLLRLGGKDNQQPDSN